MNAAAVPKISQRLVLTQPARGYRYSLDPFLLAAFCRPRQRERILDLGAGVGVIGLLLACRVPTARVVGVELEADLARHAAENARANGLAERCHFIRADLREAPRFLPAEHFDRVVANPPFRKKGAGAVPPDPTRAGARLETTFGLSDLARVAAAMLRFGGTLDIVHVAERLPELVVSLAAGGIESKVLRLVAPFPDAPPRLCLLTGIKGGRPGLRVLPQLVLHDRPGPQAEERPAPRNGGARRRKTPREQSVAAPVQLDYIAPHGDDTRMVPGFNTDFTYRGRTFHVQTEDNGTTNPVVVSLLYYKGAILASRKASYRELLGRPDCGERIKEMMKTQHKGLMRELLAGAYDAKFSAAAKSEGVKSVATPAIGTRCGAAPGGSGAADTTLDVAITRYLEEKAAAAAGR